MNPTIRAIIVVNFNNDFQVTEILLTCSFIIHLVSVKRMKLSYILFSSSLLFLALVSGKPATNFIVSHVQQSTTRPLSKCFAVRNITASKTQEPIVHAVHNVANCSCSEADKDISGEILGSKHAIATILYSSSLSDKPRLID